MMTWYPYASHQPAADKRRWGVMMHDYRSIIGAWACQLKYSLKSFSKIWRSFWGFDNTSEFLLKYIKLLWLSIPARVFPLRRNFCWLTGIFCLWATCSFSCEMEISGETWKQSAHAVNIRQGLMCSIHQEEICLGTDCRLATAIH